MSSYFSLLVAALAVVATTTTNAHPADLSALSGVTSILGVAVKNADVLQTPVNSVLLQTGLTPCQNTVELSKFVGTCIPAHLNCVGVDVLNEVTQKLVNIPACGDGDPVKASAAANIVQTKSLV